MAERITFSEEIAHLLYAAPGKPVRNCMQCGTCTGSCPAAPFMDHSPRRLVGMIAAGLRQEVLGSNTYWLCASCYLCSVRCPRGIDIAELMYGLKRLSMWKSSYKRTLVGPGFSKGFVRMILRRGRSYEMGLAPSFVFKYGLRNMLRDAHLFFKLLLRGRLSLLPGRTRRVRALRQIVGRIIPIGVVS